MIGKKLNLGILLMLSSVVVLAQQPAKIREYKKEFRTYPFSDPDPVPEVNKIYPYFRFDGYTNTPVNKEWTVVELENEYIKVMVLPEIGGKVWAAIDKPSDKSFIYYNRVVKFRDVAMRGPWTSGGLEPNYGIVGHTPNCATPVDYTIINRPDGSVSCVVGVLDLLTRSVWRVDVNLQKDKAFFTTSSTWYNASPFEQPYYHWMNGALRAADDLQFVFPGTKYIGHGGEHSPWPVDEKGRDLSFYRNNNFGSYKSYHVFGKHTNFWGAYYHDEDFGMARYSGNDDKAGKKIWIWGLSREGMIWDSLLTDSDGQYVEVQSGRLFNQPAEGSSQTPFKNRGFTPHATDKWTEYWMPVKKTKGLDAASQYGSLNVTSENGQLKIYFLPVQEVNDVLRITANGKEVYSKKLDLQPMQLFEEAVGFTGDTAALQVELGMDKLSFNSSPDAGTLARPFESPRSFDWNSVQGLHLQGKEYIRQRLYRDAEVSLRKALNADSNYLPALADYAMLMYRQMNYSEALAAARTALSIDAYDPASNYYYGLVNEKLGNKVDAKDGFDMATQSVEFRSAAFTRLANIYLKDSALDQAMHYARKAIDANRFALDAYQLIAVAARQQNNKAEAMKVLDSLVAIDPLSHFSRFERFLWEPSQNNKEQFTGMIRNEMPEQTFLELATWYYNAGKESDALAVLNLSKPNAEISYWKSFLSDSAVEIQSLQPAQAFPFRHETAEILQQLIKKYDHWLLKYHLALIRWNSNDTASAQNLFDACGFEPSYAPFYSARAKLFLNTNNKKAYADMQKARTLDKNEWRYARDLISFHLANGQPKEARALAAAEFKKYPKNFVLGMLYARTLIETKDYASANNLLNKLEVLPNEGATGGRILYRNTKLMLALQNMQSGKYKNALRYIEESRLWPERLGSGKPYDEDIDERLEDWLAYVSHSKMNNASLAQASLERIINHNASTRERRPSINDLITALAMNKLKQDGAAYLRNRASKFPNKEIAKWNISKIEGGDTPPPASISENDLYQLLQQADVLK